MTSQVDETISNITVTIAFLEAENQEKKTLACILIPLVVQ